MTFGVVGSRMRRDEEVHIPSELLSEILKRVPAKKLLQLQCVCKSWKSLISSSAFVSCHNLNTVTTTTTTSCVTSSGGSRLQLTTKYYRDVTTGGRLTVEMSCDVQHEGDTNKFTPLGYPDIPNYRIDDLWSPGDMFHGVIFLRYVHMYDRNESLLCVWNPCIRKHVILPWRPMAQVQGSRRSFYKLEGAWFDATNNDLKVMRSQLEGSYDLLSVRNGVWRMNLPFPRPRLTSAVKGVFFNGSIHWIVGARGHYEFMRFDWEQEEFNVMDIPSQLVQGSSRQPILFLLDLGAGTMLSLVKFVSNGLECELWLMHPGSSSSSWARLDPNHPRFAAAATRDVISCSAFTFKPLFHHHGRFKVTTNRMKKFYHFKETMMLMDIGSYHFKETMMLMDIGSPSSSKLHHRYTCD